jgi:hypothetical protein
MAALATPASADTVEASVVEGMAAAVAVTADDPAIARLTGFPAGGRPTMRAAQLTPSYGEPRPPRSSLPATISGRDVHDKVKGTIATLPRLESGVALSRATADSRCRAGARRRLSARFAGED